MKKNYFLFLFLAFFIKSNCQTNVITKNKPSWVSTQNFEQDPKIHFDDISQGSILLLADYQVHIPKQASFFRFVTKITDNVGIQSASNINVSYDPLYQKLIFHEIIIKRDGKTVNKLDVNQFQVMRRELNAENHLYDGSLSAMINLSDIRSNDIIDYSYSIIGFNPIHNNKFSNSYYLNDVVPVGKVNVSLISNKKLNYKTINTNLSPEISKKNGLNYYQWLVINPTKFEYEDSIPIWKLTYHTLLVSEYDNWSDVVNWGVNVYETNSSLDTSLKSKINEIKTANKTPGKKIKAVLDFVQNDIRYLGYELGVGSYKPNNPSQVFNQRYGDCKDKSLLMVTMLQELDIEAYPMLVNTSLKHVILDLLPSPIFFDHCVVKVIDKAGNIFYYDPTLTNQGGTFKNTHFPNYEYGLVLQPEETVFDEIVSNSSNKVTTNEEYILEEVNKGATLKIVTTYSEAEADNMRNYFKNNSMNGIIKDYENFYANYYFNIKSLKTPIIKDNLDKNEFVVFEEYKIDSIWTPMQHKENYIAATFTPTSLLNILYIPTKEKRDYEVSLPYPVARQHDFKIKLPKTWNVENMDDIVSSDIFYYDWYVNYDKKKNEVDVKHYLKIQNSHILPTQFKEYQNNINRVDKSFGFTLYIPKTQVDSESNGSNKNIVDVVKDLFKIFIYVLIAIILLLLLLWLFKKYRSA
ncbi:DUF3857 domain-containing transglutaminase family protein [Hanstruepera ponticola]|uniref:DUF3857 domain-containing transglutaminase family protein n=1 Tax=Hanstruepera ponticola TaxID=2042995 RepID=UPI000CF05B18|nr:DUF3857 and transglutaminase domain-containing protein [Hanstruepera ponticola]